MRITQSFAKAKIGSLFANAAFADTINLNLLKTE